MLRCRIALRSRSNSRRSGPYAVQVSQPCPKVEILPPPIPVNDADPPHDIGGFVRDNPGFPLGFRTSGDATVCLRQLQAFRQRGQFDWQASYWWEHDAEPLGGAGHYSDAEAVLRDYVAAATAGIGSVVWFDLRDDDNNPANPATMCGLVQRDFSPRTSLLGYASAAGVLTGCLCVGPVAGTPEAFDSALFVGTNRQVAVLLPQPNRVLPAVVAPHSGKPGQFAVQDFERRERPMLTSSAAPLVPTIPRPLFVTLTFKQTQSEPQVDFARPWLRVPATVFCGANAPFTVELDALCAAAELSASAAAQERPVRILRFRPGSPRAGWRDSAAGGASHAQAGRSVRPDGAHAADFPGGRHD